MLDFRYINNIIFDYLCYNVLITELKLIQSQSFKFDFLALLLNLTFCLDFSFSLLIMEMLVGVGALKKDFSFA